MHIDVMLFSSADFIEALKLRYGSEKTVTKLVYYRKVRADAVKQSDGVKHEFLFTAVMTPYGPHEMWTRIALKCDASLCGSVRKALEDAGFRVCEGHVELSER